MTAFNATKLFPPTTIPTWSGANTVLYSPNTPQVDTFMAGLFAQPVNGSTGMMQNHTVRGFNTSESLLQFYHDNAASVWAAVAFDDGLLPPDQPLSYTLRFPRNSVPPTETLEADEHIASCRYGHICAVETFPAIFMFLPR